MKGIDSSTPDDDLSATINYEYRDGAYLMALPVRITVTDGTGAVLRQREGMYDTKGNLRSVTYVSGNDRNTTTMGYYEDGNLASITMPPNGRSQRYSLLYGYDSSVQTFVTSITDSFGLRSQSIYNLDFGTPIVQSDTNGNTMYYYYDSFGRTKRIVGPYDAGSYTISYSYDINSSTPTCITRNKGYHADRDFVDTIVRIDGLKRVVSTAVSSEVNGSVGYRVSGAIEYDAMGRIIRQGQPEFNASGSIAAMKNPTETTYDSIGRKRSITFPDNSEISYDYAVSSYNGRKSLVTKVTDQEERQKTSYRDIRNNILMLQQPKGVKTKYTYDPLGQIKTVEDGDGNVTTIAYDGFGRRRSINNPDTGRTIFTYDNAGNMTRKITASLNAQGRAIHYHYDQNRLVQIDYPFMDDVYYTYGKAGAGYNRAGRVYKIDNGNAKEELYFGKLGETTKSVKTIRYKNKSYGYTTKYTFDNMGRLRRLIYPDGEILTYGYNKGGLLKSALGETRRGKRVYLENMEYDEFGQRTNITYGNGAKSIYGYDDKMHRLKSLKTTSGGGKVLQNITYNYDKVGNIVSRNNNGFVLTDDKVRNSEQSYSYDGLDRLISSNGKFDHETWNPFWNKRVNTYTSTFKYGLTGKITRKTQNNTGLIEDTNETVTIDATTYDWEYKYGGAQPNAVTEAGSMRFTYDLNGNMTEMKDSAKSLTRSLTWDDENRLVKTLDTSTLPNSITNKTVFRYDASGKRVIKDGKYGTVQYVNQNFVVRNSDLISKHVFAGNIRLVSQLVMKEEQSGKMVETDHGAYYYHPDHLGSSSVVTDKDGKFYESLEYFPFGETWIHNKVSSEQQSTPYKYTSKEQDKETGWYYFGDRYLDVRLSRWIAADPPLRTGEYLPQPNKGNDNLPGMGGVYNYINLDAYQYAGQNPVRLLDPDGNDVAIFIDYHAAGHMGHSAEAVFEKGGNGKVTYLSYGPVSSGKPIVRTFENKNLFLKFLKESKYGDNPTKGSGFSYDNAVVIKTSALQDKKIINAARTETEKERWSLLGNLFGAEYDDNDVNCKDLVRNSLNAGGIKTQNRKTPNDWHKEVIFKIKNRNVLLEKEINKVLKDRDNSNIHK